MGSITNASSRSQQSRQEVEATLDAAITRATDALLTQQKDDGHWIFELEADASFPAQCILLVHFFGETPEAALEQKFARYLRRTQLPGGGWPAFVDGPMDVSPSVQAYFAFKMAGDAPDAAHMVRARKAILAAGGGEEVNVFTRVLLALFGVLTWDAAVPMMPVEVMLLPQWCPFHLSKFAYWARTTIIPLLVVIAMRPVAANPRAVRIDELFRKPPTKVGMKARAPHQSKAWYAFFRSLDVVLRFIDPLVPTALRQRAIETAVSFVNERANGEDGFGAIFPAIIYSTMMFHLIGDYSARDTARRALERLFVITDEEAYCQPVLNASWDTVFAAHALLETGDERAVEAAQRGLKWLESRQILDVRGDWESRRPHVRPGGWAFYYRCPHYPDVDDTVCIVMAMQRADPRVFAESISRGYEWTVGMQSSNGGWGAYDSNNTHYYINNVPFADHGAMLDPPTADITGNCLSMLSQVGKTPAVSDAARKACEFLLREQKQDGSWYGRWGINYIWGTWCAVRALNLAGMPHDCPEIRRAVNWLVGIQNGDGGWGEDASSYKLDYTAYEPAPSTASQTAWALMALMAAGEINHPALVRGVTWLLRTQRYHKQWDEIRLTGTGFPRVLLLRYHGYSRYYPLLALARYRNLKRDNLTRVRFGV